MATVDAFLTALRSEVGYLEHPPGSNKTKFAEEAGHMQGAPWCSTFLVAVARRVGLELASYNPYTPTMANQFKREGRWSTTPQVGDVAFWDFPDSKHRIQHVSVVLSFNRTSIVDIGGNTSSDHHGSEDNGGGVFIRKRPRKWAVGFGRPYFTADPVPQLIVEVLVDKLTGHPITVTTGHGGRGQAPLPAGVKTVVSITFDGSSTVAAPTWSVSGGKVNLFGAPPDGVVTGTLWAAT